MSNRKIWREGDENVCSLGFRWGLDECDPHIEYAIYRLQKKLILAAKEGDKPVVDYLGELVKRCLLSDDRDPCHVYGLDFVRIIDAAILAK